jgi:hypothetical protein
VPVLRHWPGAETIYDLRWIHRGPAEMAAAITALGSEEDRRLAGDAAHGQAAGAFGLERVCQAWRGLLNEDLDPAVPGPILDLLGSRLALAAVSRGRTWSRPARRTGRPRPA